VTFTATGTAGAPAQLLFTGQPGRTLAGVTIQPAVAVSIADGFGNVTTDSLDQVSLALAGANGASLSGTTTIQASNGVATFPDLSVAQSGTGYTLLASAASLGSATSAAFDVVPVTPYLLNQGDMPTPRLGFSATAGPDGLIYTIGGISSGTVTGTVEAYSPTTGTWTTMPPLPSPRYGACATTSGGLVYVMGGYAPDGTLLSSVAVFDPATGTWSTAPSMPTAAAYSAATTGSGGTIYVIAGTDATGSPTKLVQTFDPATGTWSTAAPLSNPETGAAATLGADGNIYLTSGTNGGGQSPPGVAVYSPSTDTWKSAAQQPSKHTSLSAATGTDGNVYVFGTFDKATVTFQQMSSSGGTSPVIGVTVPYAGATAVTGSNGQIFIFGGVDSLGNPVGTVLAYGPSVGVSPAAGPPGTVVSVSGINFAASATVNVYWQSIAGANLIATGSTDASGTIASPIQAVIPSTPGGQLVVVDTTSAYPVTVTFTVQ
jgi:hypothetical protein